MEKPTVWPAMGKAFESAHGDLIDRLLAALEAAQREGGDIRGKQSAAILVVRAKSTGRPWADKIIDLRVDDSAEPFKELRRLLNMSLGVPQKFTEHAAQLSKEGKHTEAIAEQKKALDINPRSEPAMYALAQRYAAAGDFKNALAQLTMAIQRQPKVWTPQAAADPLFAKMRDQVEFKKLIGGN